MIGADRLIVAPTLSDNTIFCIDQLVLQPNGVLVSPLPKIVSATSGRIPNLLPFTSPS